jgi:asparagine synthase (glutamine-hydrolysing)
MCGIHLIWGKGANREAIQQLVDSSMHRGPDHAAVYSPWTGLWIGVNRLKILHPGQEADQPFWDQDGKRMLIFNGEIYNFLDLRILLSRMGVEFTTQSDTEVLLHYLKHFGAEGLDRLNGMFTLIYVDLISKSVLVAVDRNGEKPLYWAQNQETLLISSEVRGIAGLRDFKPDWEQVEHYFYFRHPYPGKTFHRGIRAWNPGQYSILSRHDTFRWNTIKNPTEPEEDPTQATFQGFLEKAIDCQFHADVPVGMLLSGGADSSLLYTLWYQKTGTILPAYTIQTEKKYRAKYRDADAASRFAKQVPIDLRLVDVDQEVFLNNWDEYLHSLDLPVGDSAGFLTWWIGKAAKSEVNVLISGAGADELWGGYRRHAAFSRYWDHSKLWTRWAGFLEKFPLGRNWRKFLSAIVEEPNHAFLNFSALQNPPQELAADYISIFDDSLPEYKRMLDFDRKVYLVQDVLKIHDNALMAHGIEGRAPYLDDALLGLWRKVKDQSFLIGKPWIKNILRENNLGWIANRRKFGFGLPLQEWLSEDGKLSTRVFSCLKAFDRSHGSHFSLPIRNLLQNPEQAVKTQFLTIYNLFLLAEWVKLHRL